jgi:Na+/proline symporter
MWLGIFAFVLIAFGSMMALLKVVSLKGDQTKTMEEYMKAGRDVAH